MSEEQVQCTTHLEAVTWMPHNKAYNDRVTLLFVQSYAVYVTGKVQEPDS